MFTFLVFGNLRHLFSSLVTVTLALSFLSGITHASETAPATPAAAKVSFLLENPLHRLAFNIGRGAKIIGDNDANELASNLERNGQVPERYKKEWNQLLILSYYILKIRDNPYYFPVGFELETGHKNVMSSDSSAAFEKGTRELFDIVNKYFGKTGTINWNWSSDDPTEVKDAKGGKWLMTQEWVRQAEYIGTRNADGWETVSPPFFYPDDLRLMGMFFIAHGQSPYGQLGEFTGGHQTFNLIPAGEKADAKLVGLAAANMLLLQAQFERAMFEVLDVKRFGAHKNFFLRPILFDHSSLLEDLKNADPTKLDINQIQDLLFDKHAAQEFEYHLRTAEYYTDKDRAEMRAWPEKKRKAWWKNWKYRSAQLRFNDEKPERTLIEIRINDHVNDNGITALRATFMYQKMLALAYDLAKQGKIWQLNVPYRDANETIDAYWARLKNHPNSQTNALFTALNLDRNDFRALKKQPGFVYKPSFKAGAYLSYGFEIETLADSIVDLIIPNDPEASKDWRNWGRKRKLSYLEKKGILIDGSYSPTIYRVLTTEFSVDTQLFPFMDADLHIEESGNLEIKSNGKFVYSLEKMHEQMKKVKKVFAGEYFGAHMHIFVPSEAMEKFKTPEEASRFVGFMERLSLYLQTKDYMDEKADPKPMHALDSWSLDRYSEKDLITLKNFLMGQVDINNIELKYHNIGFRKVRGGVDIELRTVGNDVDFGAKILTRVQEVLQNPDAIGKTVFTEGSALFHEFRDPVSRDNTREYELSEALQKRFPQITAAQKALAHKLQFEMYRPSMGDYMFFGKSYFSADVAPSQDLTLHSARANFESNIAIPLQDFTAQSYISEADLTKLNAAKEEYLKQMYKLVQNIEKQVSTYLGNKFLLEPNYLYLAEYLRRSTAVDRPNFEKYDHIPKIEKTRQRRILENITVNARAILMNYIINSGISAVYEKSALTSASPIRSAAMKVADKTAAPVVNLKLPLTTSTALTPLTCSTLFN